MEAKDSVPFAKAILNDDIVGLLKTDAVAVVIPNGAVF
jgi:hypothetical protein